MRTLRAVLAPLVVILACEPAVPSQRTLDETRSPILGGVDDATHTGVGIVYVTSPEGSGICSGALISPTLFLLARHCVSELLPAEGDATACEAGPDAEDDLPARLSEPWAPTAFKVSFAAVGDETTGTPVKRVAVPPMAAGEPMCGSDLALL